MRAKVIVLAGPSGSGKSRLCARLGLPTVNLDDFYKDGSDPTLPRRTIGPGRQIVDWDHPGSWLHEEAADTLERLCRDGSADVPVYDIAHDGRVGHRLVDLAEATLVVAEGSSPRRSSPPAVPAGCWPTRSACATTGWSPSGAGSPAICASTASRRWCCCAAGCC